MKISDSQNPGAISRPRFLRRLGLFAEIILLGALILVTRCANFTNVFVDGKIYFVDADCYSRMTRARMVVEHPGLVIRHENFEKFPIGVNPHTTAPFDYLIAGLTSLLAPLTAQPLDLAGALISPLLALAGGWFLCWWVLRMGFRYRWAAPGLFALSPILAHGTALGRPDHQSLLIVLVLVALAAEWTLQEISSRGWSIVSGLAWGFALWVSLYEPLLIFATLLLFRRSRMFARARWVGWAFCGAILLLAAIVERRLPELPPAALAQFFTRWSSTIGELHPVSLTNPVWLQWCGLAIVIAPVLIFFALRSKKISPAFVALLALTFVLTIWQARWSYFFVIVFALVLPALFEFVRQRWLGNFLLAISLLPCLLFWRATLWPNDQLFSDRAAQNLESAEWRAAATMIAREKPGAFLAPWWLSPEVAYWSGQPGVAGSSHESLDGIVASARFFASDQPNESREILRARGVRWVLVYDGARVAENSAAILGAPVSAKALCFLLDRTPSRAPAFLELAGQTSSCKIYAVRN
jgi:hypothetical protein